MDDNGWDRIAECDRDVFVGSRWCCDQLGHEFGKRIHIQYPNRECLCKNLSPGDLVLDLVEREPLGFKLLDRIYEFAKIGGKLFVHCRAGMCRGPTVAVACLVSRGMTVGEAMGTVVDAMVSQYKWFPLLPEFHQPVMQEIHEWNQKRLG